ATATPTAAPRSTPTACSRAARWPSTWTASASATSASTTSSRCARRSGCSALLGGGVGGRDAAVDQHGCAVRPACFVAGQVEHGVGDLLRLAEAAVGQVHRAALPLVLVGEEGADHAGVDRARADGVA